jgi:hypothetical protein
MRLLPSMAVGVFGKSAEEWLPVNLCSKKLAAVAKNLEVTIYSALPEAAQKP